MLQYYGQEVTSEIFLVALKLIIGLSEKGEKLK
jgi:hypothetical protein